MLDFFRKYQRYFFLVVTVVIIISFSFFGTYSTIGQGNYHEQVAFTAIDGTPIKRSELDQLALFIGTDVEDKRIFGGVWGPNFLNDGIVKKDFLETGLAELIALQYASDVQQDFQGRLEKEKRYQPYFHPQARFVGAETVWNYFAPPIKQNLDLLRSNTSAITPEAIAARIDLYLAEKKLPAPSLRQLLLYQQRQYGWLSPDPDLERIDLSLFNYHTFEDWFGPRFLRLIAEFIINSSIVAEQEGYQVTRTEALADLMRNSEISFKQNLNNPHLGVANGAEYFNEQLHRLGLDQNKAATIWRRVLLFQRLFHDMGNSVFVDPLTFQNLNEYAKETVEGELYKLPKDLQFSNYRTLQEFEVYLDAISKRTETEKGLLSVPTSFYSVEEVARKAPELVQKRYLLNIAKVDKSTLSATVGVKDTWNWEVEEKNWEKLKQQFPDLGVLKGEDREARFAALDGLDDKTRAAVDLHSRKEIVNAHPEWIEKALQEADAHPIIISLKLKGENVHFAGLKNPEALMKLLDGAKLGEQDPALAHYTADNNTFYRIVVIDRGPQMEILTFAEAYRDGTLEALLDKKLESYYKEKEYQKPFPEVRDEVADLYFAKLLKAIQNDYAAGIAPEKPPAKMINEMSASLRFYGYMRDILSKLKKNPQSADMFVTTPTENAQEGKLSPRESLFDQFKLEKTLYHANRGNENDRVQEAFSLPPNGWTKVQTPVNGDLYFFHLLKKGSEADAEALNAKVEQARSLLSDEAQRILGDHLLKTMKQKGALSLEYMSQPRPEHDEQDPYMETDI